MKRIIVSLSLIFISNVVFGWGQTGHRTVARVAENHLSKKARKKLFEIMGHESLVEASTWMDNIKSDSTYDYAKTWHYVTVPDGKTYQSAEKSETGDAYEAINRLRSVVKNENSTIIQKQEAIRMLVHIIGDFHQPLHVGNGTDRGGNQVKIKWFSTKSNLHRIWDSGIIERKGFSYSELAELIDHPTEQANLNSTDLDVWVAEAQALRPQIYASSDQDRLSYEYMYKNWDTLKDQLLKGGIRLAAVLNEILED